MNKYLLITGASLFCLTLPAEAGNDELEIDFNHRLMLDGDYLSDWYSQENEFNGEVRRLQSSVSLKKQDWSFKLKLDIDIDNKEIDVDDAYVQYRGWDWAQLKIGKHKEVFGLEHSTSSSQISTIERSMATNAFGPGRNYGVSLKGKADQFNWWLGAYDNDGYDGNGYGITGRATYQLVNQADNSFHLGASFSQRDLDGAEVDIKSALEIHTADDVLDTKKQALDNLTLFGLESQWSNGKVRLAGEWMIQKFTLSDSGENVEHNGLYGQASYLFGEGTYQLKKGKLATPKLSKKLNSWEMVSRYSQLDTLESEHGTEVENWTLGLNYYHGKRLKIMSGVTYSKTTLPFELSGTAFSLRFQYSL